MEAKEIAALQLGEQNRKLTFYGEEFKKEYKRKHPDRKPVFDSFLVTFENGVIWKGDIDMVSDVDKLQAIANELNNTLYIVQKRGVVYVQSKMF